MTRAAHEIGGLVPADSPATPGFSSLSDFSGPASQQAPELFGLGTEYTGAELLAIKEAVQAGEDDAAIGARVGRTPGAIKTLRNKMGWLRPAKPSRCDLMAAEIRRRWAAGDSQDNIARDVGVSVRTLRAWIVAQKIPARPRAVVLAQNSPTKTGTLGRGVHTTCPLAPRGRERDVLPKSYTRTTDDGRVVEDTALMEMVMRVMMRRRGVPL